MTEGLGSDKLRSKSSNCLWKPIFLGFLARKSLARSTTPKEQRSKQSLITATAKSNATCNLSTYENYSPALKLKASGSDLWLVNILPPIVAPPPFKLSRVRSTKLRTDFTRDNAICRLQPSFCMRYAITKVALLCQKKSELRLWLLKQQKSSHHDIMTSGFSVQKTTGINQEWRSGCLTVGWQSINVNFQAGLIWNHKMILWPSKCAHTVASSALNKSKETTEPIFKTCFFQVVPTTRSTHLFLPSKQWSNTLPVALPASMKRKTSSKWDVTLERSFFWWKRPGKIWMKFLMRTPSPNIYYTRKTVKHANIVLCDGGKSQKLPLPKENKGSHWSANSDGCRWGFAQNFWYLIRLSGRNCIQSQKKLHPKEEHFFWKLKLPYQHCIPHKLHRSPVQVTSVRGESLRAICKVFSGKALLGGHSWLRHGASFEHSLKS